MRLFFWKLFESVDDFSTVECDYKNMPNVETLDKDYVETRDQVGWSTRVSSTIVK
jgi:hypothetical protein